MVMSNLCLSGGWVGTSRDENLVELFRKKFGPKLRTSPSKNKSVITLLCLYLPKVIRVACSPGRPTLPNPKPVWVLGLLHIVNLLE